MASRGAHGASFHHPDIGAGIAPHTERTAAPPMPAGSLTNDEAPMQRFSALTFGAFGLGERQPLRDHNLFQPDAGAQHELKLLPARIRGLSRIQISARLLNRLHGHFLSIMPGNASWIAPIKSARSYSVARYSTTGALSSSV